MTLNALVALLGLTAILCFIAAGRSMGRGRIASGLFRGVVAAAFLLMAGATLLVGASLRSYQRFGAEQAAGAMQFTRIGPRLFNGTFTLPSGDSTEFELRGDEWQIDARVLKWRGPADLLGVDAGYRLDRISGRYTNIEDERSQPRTVYALHRPERLDLWELVRRYHAWVPWVDALYGSAAFLPMADGARYRLSVSQSGLIARPVNQEAAAAVGEWH